MFFYGECCVLSGWFLVQRSPTACDASLCVILKPQECGDHGPIWATAQQKKRRRKSNQSIIVRTFTINLKNCINPLTPNDDYSGRIAPLTSKRFILYIYSTNTGTEYFKHGIYSPFFPLQNTVCFINLTYSVPVFFTFYIQGVLK